MNLSEISFIPPSTERPSNYSIIKRLLNLALVIVGVIICFNVWLNHANQSRIWYQQQASQLGRSLTHLSSQLLTKALINDDKEQIQAHLNFLKQDSYVTGVALYNQKGQLIQDKDNQVSMVARMKMSSSQSLIFIQNIVSENGEIIGYLRLILDEKKVMQFHFDYQNELLQQIEVLLLLAALVGLLLTRAFYTFRYRKYRKKSEFK